jgi:hypothetical protein
MFRPSRPYLAVPAVAALLLAVIAAPTMAASDPPGSNGTVKVSGKNVDGIPDNEPHQGCTFNVEFYGFDQGGNLIATASFTVLLNGGAEGPTFTFPEVWIGEDPASGAGTVDGIDASRNYNLNEELYPYVDASNPNQGVHVRLTVHAEGVADSVATKQKTFWATGCVHTPPPPPPDS